MIRTKVPDALVAMGCPLMKFIMSELLCPDELAVGESPMAVGAQLGGTGLGPGRL